MPRNVRPVQDENEHEMLISGRFSYRPDPAAGNACNYPGMQHGELLSFPDQENLRNRYGKCTKTNAKMLCEK